MPKIVWDAIGEKKFESGIDHGVLYNRSSDGEYKPGVAWNGLTSVSETPEGAEPESQYADNIKYVTMVGAEEHNGTIEAFQSPPEFDRCDGNAELMPGVIIGQQNRETFGLSYRTKIGNDVDGQDAAYKLHLVYGCTASPSERTYETLNDSPEPITLSWDYTTTPVPVTGHKPTSLLTVYSDRVDAAKLTALEDILYGTETEEARLPLPDEVLAILSGGDTEEARLLSMRADY